MLLFRLLTFQFKYSASFQVLNYCLNNNKTYTIFKLHFSYISFIMEIIINVTIIYIAVDSKNFQLVVKVKVLN